MYLNPYLFLLLKKLIQVEVKLTTGKKPVIENIKAFIADKEGATDDDTAKVTIAAWAIAEYIRKMWSKQIFSFPVFYLDRMVMTLQKLTSYKDWEDFVAKEIKIGGDTHQHDMTPLFSDDTIGSFSFRAWGDFMAAVWSEHDNKITII